MLKSLITHISYFFQAVRFIKTPCPSGKYTTFLEPDKFCAISSPASSFLSSINPSPALLNASDKSSAPLASPSAVIIAACFCCSA